MRSHGREKLGGDRVAESNAIDVDHSFRVTVITVTWEAEETIDATMGSILSQTCEGVEIVVVDGASPDSTLTRLKAFEDRIHAIVSEPDQGIYDAMNKGVALARGEFILFMNAGDRFHDADSLSALVDAATADDDIIYGDHVVTYPDGSCREVAGGVETALWKGMICSHQAMIARRALLLAHPFKLDRLGADFDFIYTCYAHGARFLPIRAIVAEVSAGGVSDRRRLRSIVSRWRTIRENAPSIRRDVYYLGLMIDSLLRGVAKAVLPDRLVRRFQANAGGQ